MKHFSRWSDCCSTTLSVGLANVSLWLSLDVFSSDFEIKTTFSISNTPNSSGRRSNQQCRYLRKHTACAKIASTWRCAIPQLARQCLAVLLGSLWETPQHDTVECEALGKHCGHLLPNGRSIYWSSSVALQSTQESVVHVHAAHWISQRNDHSSLGGTAAFAGHSLCLAGLLHACWSDVMPTPSGSEWLLAWRNFCSHCLLRILRNTLRGVFLV